MEIGMVCLPYLLVSAISSRLFLSESTNHTEEECACFSLPAKQLQFGTVFSYIYSKDFFKVNQRIILSLGCACFFLPLSKAFWCGLSYIFREYFLKIKSMNHAVFGYSCFILPTLSKAFWCGFWAFSFWVFYSLNKQNTKTEKHLIALSLLMCTAFRMR